MVFFTSFALLSLAAVGTYAGPVEKRWQRAGNCMSSADAQQVVDNYAELIRAFTVEGADKALSPSFTDYSEGVNTLIDTCPQGAAAQTLPLLSPSFSNRQEFITGQGQQPGINFNQLGIWNTCNTAIVRWESTNTANITEVRPVVGIIILEVEQSTSSAQYPWIIKEVFSEFDSGAWLQNLEQQGNVCASVNSASPTIATPAVSSASATGSSAASAAATTAVSSGSYNSSSAAAA